MLDSLRKIGDKSQLPGYKIKYAYLVFIFSMVNQDALGYISLGKSSGINFFIYFNIQTTFPGKQTAEGRP